MKPLEWEGPEFKVGGGLTEYQRHNYEDIFPVGTIIVFLYNELNKESMKPRFPRFKNKVLDI